MVSQSFACMNCKQHQHSNSKQARQTISLDRGSFVGWCYALDVAMLLHFHHQSRKGPCDHHQNTYSLHAKGKAGPCSCPPGSLSSTWR